MRIAPRYDPRIVEAVRSLDDERHPIAETCRRIAAFAEGLGLTRPSHVHLRALVSVERKRRIAERRRRQELIAIAKDVYVDLNRGFLVDAWEVEERVRNAGRGTSD